MYVYTHTHLCLFMCSMIILFLFLCHRFSYQKSKSSPTVVMATSNNTLPDGEPFANKTLKSQALGSGWNVFGIPPNPRSVNYAKYHQTKLW